MRTGPSRRALIRGDDPGSCGWELDEALHRQLEAHIEDRPVIDGLGRLAGRVDLSAGLKPLRRHTGPTRVD